MAGWEGGGFRRAGRDGREESDHFLGFFVGEESVLMWGSGTEQMVGLVRGHQRFRSRGQIRRRFMRRYIDEIRNFVEREQMLVRRHRRRRENVFQRTRRLSLLTRTCVTGRIRTHGLFISKLDISRHVE
uniref:Uncharacterized protein n=1 Tax=Cacopsylla melanoneura TaxID=428564 RepID=A0A8D8WWQ1_9HEMI